MTSKEYPEKSRYFPYDEFKNYIKGDVLEIGCAEGNNTRFLIDKYGIKRMFCIEIDISRLEKARKKANAFFVNADARFLPFKEDIFDSVYCSEVMEHLPSKKDHSVLVKGIKWVMKDKSYAIMTTPNKPVYTLFRWLTLKRNDPTHRSEISYLEFRNLVSGKFKNTRFIGIFGVFGWLMKIRLFSRIHKALMQYPSICKALIAVSRKENDD